MMMAELKGLAPGLSSMIEKQPQMRCSAQACLNAATSGPSSEHMMAGSVLIGRPCSAYSGNTTRSIVGMLRRGVSAIGAKARGLRRAGSRAPQHWEQLRDHPVSQAGEALCISAREPI